MNFKLARAVAEKKKKDKEKVFDRGRAESPRMRAIRERMNSRTGFPELEKNSEEHNKRMKGKK